MPTLTLTNTTRRWACMALIGLSVVGTAACKGNSTTQIEPGKIFVLGGEHTAPLQVEGRNVGPVPVEILKEKDGVRTSVATVAPGALFSKTFAAKEAALVRNTSPTQRAMVAVEFNRDVSSLSMRYLPNP
jgi:hypothetical protein